MANYEVFVPEEISQKLINVGKTCDISVDDIISELIKDKIDDFLIDYIITQYKAGKIKAREAWKASGLNYQEFQSRSQA